MRMSYFVTAIVIVISSPAMGQHTRAPKLGSYAYLEIMHEQQSPDLCLPTCVAMALNFYGEGKTQWTIKRLSNEHKDLFSGTSFEEIQQGIKPLGYSWDRWQWPGDSVGFHNALSAVEQSLDDGKPVILEVIVRYFARSGPSEVSPPSARTRPQQAGHALLAFGYDNSEKQLFVMDPAMKFPGKRYIPFEELQDMWYYADGRFHGLFTAPLGQIPAGHPSGSQ